MRKGSGGASLKLALLLPLVAGAAAPAPVPDSRPPTVSVMTNGLTSGYAVRFGEPVDHAFSRLLIVQVDGFCRLCRHGWIVRQTYYLPAAGRYRPAPMICTGPPSR
jgi:hypothetical protein